MKTFFAILAVVLVGCKENLSKPPAVYLQTEEVALVAPIIKASSLLIDSTATLTAFLDYPETKIYYTKDGNAPTQNSTLYTKPLLVSETGLYSFKAFHSQLSSSGVSSVTIYKKGLSVEDIVLETPINDSYPGMGATTLVNHEKGSNNFYDGQWMGFEEDLIAKLQLGENEMAKSLNIGYMCNVGSWIFPPVRVIVFTSNNGSDFVEDSIAQLPDEVEGAKSGVRNIEVKMNHPSRFIKVKIENLKSIPSWHEGAGKKAWLFLDEIIVN